jgi:hypothetical protein
VVGILHYVETEEEVSLFLGGTEERVLVMPAKVLSGSAVVNLLQSNGTDSKVKGILLLESEAPSEPFSPAYVCLVKLSTD